MPLAILFWVLMIVWMVFGYIGRPANAPYYWPGALLNFVLFAILGWAVFGAAIK